MQTNFFLYFWNYARVSKSNELQRNMDMLTRVAEPGSSWDMKN